MSDILEKDTDILFPYFSVLKASAGSGKTYVLTKRFVQFLLSEKVPANDLRNIMAITFSNNAAKEMKGRILNWLKSLYLADPRKLDEMSLALSLDKNLISQRAERLIDRILDNYSDFQVKTIDSFMTTVFKASAIDFGYNPEFEILMNSDAVMRYSFDLFLRNVKEGTPDAALFEAIISFILENKKTGSTYPWDPSAVLLEEIKKLYKKIAATGKTPVVEDLSAELKSIKGRIGGCVEGIESAIADSGLERNGGSAFPNILLSVRAERFADLVGRGAKSPPVKKLKKPGPASQRSYDEIIRMWGDLGEMVRQYTSLHIRSYYTPYLKVFGKFSDSIETIKRHQGKVFIEDINWKLAEYLDGMTVPEVYFRIGETIFHYLIDEFQDTSPVQWRNLFPLIENSLSQGGSAFVVGDTKQAIYGFRNADYRIMKSVEKLNPFRSARHVVGELGTNFRSLRKIVEFNEKVFRQGMAGHELYGAAGRESGLTNYEQKVEPGRNSDGYCETIILQRNDEDPPERLKVQEIVSELTARGYKEGDIAILTQRNEDAVRATFWLNERGIPFISFSSLDVRRRKITGEIVALLSFLDSPTDNLSFATFILGEIFRKTLEKYSPGPSIGDLREFLFRSRGRSTLYKEFQKEFGKLWEAYFEGLFKSAGYLPVYDLLSETLSTFRVFEILSEEEATLVKLLEVVKDLEGEGYNSIKNFLASADESEDGDAQWNMDVPAGLNAVKVMTIHKAKGLGFPAVIVLLYEEKNKGYQYILQEKDEGVCLLKINQSSKCCDSVFEELYNDESLRETVSRLNSLYVGFTRPEEALYVIGVKGNGECYPFDLLPADAPAAGAQPVRESTESSCAERAFDILHRHNRIAFRFATEEIMNIAERKRGEFIHEVLSSIEYTHGNFESELPSVIRKASEETGAQYPEDAIRETVVKMFSNPEIAAYFRMLPGRRIRNEQEFSDMHGGLFRMDRVVIDPENVTVIDYKTGHDRRAEEKHAAQMKNYIRILAGIYPEKAVSGIIAYVDLAEIKRVL